ncbi:MAG TPA: glycoside hydrolase family 97 N-terminal domain-containing protein, partial [Bryobacteraceae bacterium]|nr:glycoside hydrolase family 97 N-terminal domain-containing protein [Bryobacteraceae bacterium]
MTKQGARRFSGGPLFPLLALTAALALPCAAQDLQRVTSPDGQLEFRIFLAQQDETTLFRLAYQVWYHEKRLLDTSFMGFDIWEQEPLLGENVGMIGSSTESKPDYHGFTGRYLQNGSLGRALNVEVRVYNSGVAFRYHLLKSMPMADLFIADETTEFALARPVPERASLPCRIEQPGTGWIEIDEIPLAGF